MGERVKLIVSKKVTYILLIVAIILISLSFVVSAQPPFQQSPQDAGYLIIETGWPEYHKIGEDLYIHTHVHNGTDGLQVTSDISCFYHTYNHQIKGGEHIDTGILTQYGAGYYNYTDGGLLNVTGQYSVLIWCNSTTEGGFSKYTFEVTYSGVSISTAQAILYGFFIFIFVFFMVSLVFIINTLPSSNTRNEEGQILSISYLKYARSALWFVEWILLIGILYISSNLAFAYLSDELFAQTLFVLFRIAFGLTPVIVIVWIVWIFVRMFHDRELQQLLNRGFFPQGRLP